MSENSATDSGQPAGGGTTSPSGPAPVYDIRAKVSDEAGNALPGVTVKLSGTKEKPEVTNADGVCLFSGLQEGDYTLAASLDYHNLKPPTVKVKLPGGHQEVSFTATRARYKLTGRVEEQAGKPLRDVKIEIGEATALTLKTDRGGDYKTEQVAGLKYSIIPSKPAYKFSPLSVSVEALGADTSTDFKAELQLYRVGGVVRNTEGNPVGGVTVTLDGDGDSKTALTDEGGRFAFNSVRGAAAYMVSPNKPGYTFTPPTMPVAHLAGDVDQTFFCSVELGPLAEKIPNQWSVINDYSKTIITLASGVLAVTVTFSSQLSNKAVDGWSNFLLTTTWALLVATIACGVLTAVFLIQYLRHGKKQDQNPVILFANLSYALLFLAGFAFLFFGARTIYSAKTWDAATAVESAFKEMPDLTNRKNAKWRLQSLLWEPSTKTYQLIVTDELTSDRATLIVDPAKNEVKKVN